MNAPSHADPTARSVAWEALNRWEHGQGHSDAILHQLLRESHLSAMDRAMVTELFYGVMRNRSRLDYVIAQLRTERPVEAKVQQLLRLGLYQIFHMRIPDHAAVDATVQLGGKARGLANAILRRSIRERSSLLTRLDSAPLHIQLSFPPFLLDRWKKHLGEHETIALARAHNKPACAYARCNQLKVTPGELRRSHPQAEPLASRPDLFQLDRIPASWIFHGLCYIQDPSTLMACEMLDPQPGDRVLDACAAPGGKTTYLAQLMRNAGRIHACDSSASRCDILHENIQRLGVSNTSIHVVDWTQPNSWRETGYQRILLDAPCSNTGVLGRRVDARWRLAPDDFKKMPDLQFHIASRLIPLLAPGGTFVYSTCSLEPEENEQVVKHLVETFSFLKLQAQRTLYPHRDGFDGAYAAKLVRS